MGYYGSVMSYFVQNLHSFGLCSLQADSCTISISSGRSHSHWAFVYIFALGMEFLYRSLLAMKSSDMSAVDQFVKPLPPASK